MAMKGIDELKNKFFWRDVFLEMFGTCVFIFMVTAILTQVHTFDIVKVSFGIGLTIAVIAHVIGPVSGAHLNPAVSFGLLIKGFVSPLRAFFYTIAEFIGGILGAAITYGITPSNKFEVLGTVKITDGVSVAQGFFVELLLTMILVLTVCASVSSDHKRKDFGYANALAIGQAIVICHLVGIPYTGSSINPARAFGPAVVTGIFPSHHWVYWLGPYVGALIAALLYQLIIAKQPVSRDESFLLSTVKDDKNETLS